VILEIYLFLDPELFGPLHFLPLVIYSHDTRIFLTADYLHIQVLKKAG
jgi:hypothetical protein